jgi:8-oxo-dGTP pyrophosphatase MutT (NUDIX family)
MNPKELSCGILVESPSGWLIAHATGTSRWDLPKGRREEGETPMQAALRECVEETGLDLTDYQSRLEDLGVHSYLPKKDLHLFRLRLPETLDLSHCSCSTQCVRRDGLKVYETDAYMWITPQRLHEKVGKSLVAYLQALDLLGPSPTAPARPRP